MQIITKHIPAPRRVSEFKRIYTPSRSVYDGVDTAHFRHGETYDWVANDFSVLRDGDEWHIVGITHPYPPFFESAFDFDPETVHEAEYQLFHATAPAKSFSELMRKDSFTDCEKILYPADRPGEEPEIWAPHLMKTGESFGIVYSPRVMRLASTSDFRTFETGNVLFTCDEPAARDPYILCENGVFTCVWCGDRGIMLRRSEDLVKWSDEELILPQVFERTSYESPFLMYREGYYYLFVCLCDGRNGCYDERTLIFAAEALDGLSGTAPIATLDAHAPEFVRDESGEYMLSVYYPENGVNAARIEFR